MWEHSEGKKELREALMTGKIPLYARDRDNKPTKPRLLEIYKSFESLASSDYSKFSSRLSALRRSVRKEKGLEEEEVVFIEPEISWGESEAKELLLQALLSGDIPLDPNDMSLIEVYCSIPELADYDYNLFSGRLSSLRKTVRNQLYRKQKDQNMFDLFVLHH